MTAEKRSTQRYPIQAIDFATMLINESYILLGSITNICRNGMNLELFPASPELAPQSGDSIRLQSCPHGLDCLLEGSTGTVSWTSDNCCGVKLATPLAQSAQELEQYFYAANLAPWDCEPVS